jgi:hypothetical protein
MQELPHFVPALSHQLKPLVRDGAQFTCMLFHPCIDGRIALASAVESQQICSCHLFHSQMSNSSGWMLVEPNKQPVI